VKVVLFCGGLGLRMGESSARVPKPMMPIGERPILWHIMKYYASFGHTEFILCLGHQAEAIKDYFLRYEALTSDFVLLQNGSRTALQESDIHDWTISFLNTGLKSSIGERLRLVRPYLNGDEMFLANYGDTLTDAPLPEMVSQLRNSGKTGLFLCTRPTYNVHVVEFDERNSVRDIRDVTKTDTWINGGYFVFRQEIFDHIHEGDDLVEEPFHRLIARDKLLVYPHRGFWAPMDTLKDKQMLEALWDSGQAPWRTPSGVLLPDVA
jgi:glucose-1-phosphate cytidylyltransferase